MFFFFKINDNLLRDMRLHRLLKLPCLLEQKCILCESSAEANKQLSKLSVENTFFQMLNRCLVLLFT